MSAIDLPTALSLTDKRDSSGQRVPFSISWTTLDRGRKTRGSEHRTLTHVVRCGASHNLRRAGQIAVQPVDGGHAIPIHMQLIEEVNGHMVL